MPVTGRIVGIGGGDEVVRGRMWALEREVKEGDIMRGQQSKDVCMVGKSDAP